MGANPMGLQPDMRVEVTTSRFLHETHTAAEEARRVLSGGIASMTILELSKASRFLKAAQQHREDQVGVKTVPDYSAAIELVNMELDKRKQAGQ